MFAPTARTIPAGQWSLGLTELVVPSAAAGLGGGVSLGAGVLASPQSGFFGTVFVEPKVTVVQRNGLAVALGATGLIDPFEYSGVESSVAPYAVATVGNATEPGGLAATVGVGARLNVERPLDPSMYLRYAANVDLLNTPPGFNVSPRGSYHVDLVPAPVAFAGLELPASDRVTFLLELAALPDRTLSYGYWCDACYQPEVGPVPSVELHRGPIHYDVSFGTAARITTGRLAVDAGIMLGRDADGHSTQPAAELVPWLNVTLALGKG